jgi:hypothetical protein
MLYKNAYLNVKTLDADPFFKEEIPETFDEIKMYALFYLVRTGAIYRKCSNSVEKAYRRQGGTDS